MPDYSSPTLWFQLMSWALWVTQINARFWQAGTSREALVCNLSRSRAECYCCEKKHIENDLLSIQVYLLLLIYALFVGINTTWLCKYIQKLQPSTIHNPNTRDQSWPPPGQTQSVVRPKTQDCRAMRRSSAQYIARKYKGLQCTASFNSTLYYSSLRGLHVNYPPSDIPGGNSSAGKVQ